MKIRNGFVSNSSSSSFVILAEELTKESLMDVFDVSESSPLIQVVNEIANSILNNAEEWTVEQFKDNFGYDDMTDEEFEDECPEYCRYCKLAEKKNWKVYYGSVDSIEDAILCDMTINFENDKMIISKEGGY